MGKVEEARQAILSYLQRESSAEGNYLAGLVYMRQGDVGSAYRYFKEAVRLQPDYYEPQQKLAEIYVSIGDLKSAQETASMLTKRDNYKEDGLLLQSEIALAEGKLDEALNKIQSAIDEKKHEIPERTLIQLAIIHARKGDRAKAEGIINKIDEKKLDAPGLITLIRYYTITARNEKVVAILNSALELYPNSPEVLYYYGLQLFSEGKYQESVPYFQKVFSIMPQSRIAAYRYGQSLVASGQLRLAERHIDDILSRHPDDILALSLKVRCELLNSHRKDAMNTLKRTIALVSDVPRPHTLLAELYWADGIFSVAEGYAQKALKLGEKSNSPRIVLGDIFTRKGQYRQAIEQYEQILEREPTNLVALVQAADCYLNLREVKKAESLYERVTLQYPTIAMIRTKLEMVRNMRKGPQGILDTAYRYYQQVPDNVQAVSGYVRALVLNNRVDDAIKVLRAAMKKDPKNVEYHFILADLFLSKRDIAAARETFEQTLQLAPKDLNVLINIGGRYEKISLDKEAEAIYLTLSKLYPDNIVVVNQLAWFYTDKRGDLEKAKPFIETLRVKGEGAYEKDTVGWYLCKTGDYGSAETYLRDALHMDPENNIIRGHLAVWGFQTGKSKDALAEAEKVVPLLPSGNLKEILSSKLEAAKKGDSRR